MTAFMGLAANFFGLSDRGYIRPGMVAEVAVTDLGRYRAPWRHRGEQP